MGKLAVINLSDDHVRRSRMAAILVHPRPPGSPTPKSVGDVVRHLGAMQAQNDASGLWSLGVRLPGSTATDVVGALEQREANRTWPMRSTVHFVPARDAHWMLATTGVRTLRASARRRAELGIDDSVAERAMDIMGQELTGGGRMSRSALLDAVASHGISMSGNVDAYDEREEGCRHSYST